MGDEVTTVHSCALRDIAFLTEGFSGRTIRKLPFLAHALFVQAPVTTLPRFLEALRAAVQTQISERQDLGHQKDGVST